MGDNRDWMYFLRRSHEFEAKVNEFFHASFPKSAIRGSRSGEDGIASVDPFLAVMNKEYNGHRRLFGRGVTRKLIKKVDGRETSYVVPGELMESMKTSIDAELSWLVEMRKHIEDDH
nr:hypothetical protein [Tanacetum cinerariifolium]